MTQPQEKSKGGLDIGARAAFTLLPVSALAIVLWLAATQDLPLTGVRDWIPALGVSLAWRLDGLSMLMLLMITGIGSAVFVYTGGYMEGHPGQRRLYLLLSLRRRLDLAPAADPRLPAGHLAGGLPSARARCNQGGRAGPAGKRCGEN